MATTLPFDQNTALVHEAALLNFLMAKLHYLDPDVIVGHGLHGFPIEVGPLLCSVLVLTLMYHGANCHHWDRYCCTGCITTRSKTGPNWAGSSEASCPFEEEVSERRVMLLLRELTVQCHHAHTCVHTHTLAHMHTYSYRGFDMPWSVLLQAFPWWIKACVLDACYVTRKSQRKSSLAAKPLTI